MRNLQVHGLWFLASISLINCYPLTIHNYAPAHDEYKPTDYSFSYGVKDLHTGDIKHQWEKKDGDSVKGHYSVVEPDGTVRTVDYTADDKSGFNAVVKHSGPFHHPVDYNHKPTSHNEVVLKPKPVEVQYEPVAAKEPEYETKYEYVYPKQYGGEYEQPEGNADYQAAAEDATYGTHQQEGEEEEEESYSTLRGKQNYVFVPPEEVAEESQRSTVRSVFNHRQTYAKQPDTIRPHVATKGEYGNVKVMPHLPVDINLFNRNPMEQVIPVDVSVINPIEIDLRDKEVEKKKHAATLQVQNKFNQKYASREVQPSYELTQQELNKYLENYYKSNKVYEPVMERGFQPIKSITKETVTQSPIQQTYKANKKPATTPGLKYYSSNKAQNNNKYSARTPKLEHFNMQKAPSRLPYQYLYPFQQDSRESRQKTDLTRLYGSSLNGNRYVRYAKHINFGQ